MFFSCRVRFPAFAVGRAIEEVAFALQVGKAGKGSAESRGLKRLGSGHGPSSRAVRNPVIPACEFGRMDWPRFDDATAIFEVESLACREFLRTRAFNAERAARNPCVLITHVTSGEQRLVRAADIAADPMADVLVERLRLGKSGMAASDGKEFFLTIQAPATRLVAIGAVHIAQALAPIAKLVDFDMIIVDPRTAFATPERFPDVELLAEWPDVALPALRLDRYTAMVLLTHDPRIDDQGLSHALRADCFYIGALGSSKTHAKRLERMRAEGFGERELARIRAPIGLDIGAVSPAEIAIAILGEIVAALRHKSLRATSEKAA